MQIWNTIPIRLPLDSQRLAFASKGCLFIFVTLLFAIIRSWQRSAKFNYPLYIDQLIVYATVTWYAHALDTILGDYSRKDSE